MSTIDRDLHPHIGEDLASPTDEVVSDDAIVEPTARELAGEPIHPSDLIDRTGPRNRFTKTQKRIGGTVAALALVGGGAFAALRGGDSETQVDGDERVLSQDDLLTSDQTTDSFGSPDTELDLSDEPNSIDPPISIEEMDAAGIEFGEVPTIAEAVDESGYPIHPVSTHGFEGEELIVRTLHNIAWMYNVGDGDEEKLEYVINDDVVSGVLPWHDELLESIQPNSPQTTEMSQYALDSQEVQVVRLGDGQIISGIFYRSGIDKGLFSGENEDYVYDPIRGTDNPGTVGEYFAVAIEYDSSGSVTGFHFEHY